MCTFQYTCMAGLPLWVLSYLGEAIRQIQANEWKRVFLLNHTVGVKLQNTLS